MIDYKDALDYKLEHPLTTGPLRVDILVVKKRPEAVIRKQIAEIFRLDNIIEYKSPTNSLSVNEFTRHAPAFIKEGNHMLTAGLRKTFEEIGLGEQWRQEGEMKFLIRQLTRRFGPLPEWAKARVVVAESAQLENWADAILDASNLAEVLGAPDNQ